MRSASAAYETRTLDRAGHWLDVTVEWDEDGIQSVTRTDTHDVVDLHPIERFFLTEELRSELARRRAP